MRSCPSTEGLDYEWPSSISSILQGVSFASGGASSVITPQCLFAHSSIPPVYLVMLMAALLPVAYTLLAMAFLVAMRFKHQLRGTAEPPGQNGRRMLTVVRPAPLHV